MKLSSRYLTLWYWTHTDLHLVRNLSSSVDNAIVQGVVSLFADSACSVNAREYYCLDSVSRYENTQRNYVPITSPRFFWQDLSVVTFSELTQLVAGFLLDSNPPHDDLRINANQQTQVVANQQTQVVACPHD